MEISTINNYKKVINICKDIYIKKSKDYGSAWRILRTTSLTDQIFIKAQRIRSVQEKKKMKVEEKIENEFIGIINYCIMAIIQMEYERDEIIKTFVNLQYKRNDQNFFRGTFRVRGETLEIFPSH